MRKTLDIASHDLRLFLVDRGNLIGLLLVPIVMTLLIGAVNSGMFSSGPTNHLLIDVIDRDGSDLSRQLMAAIREANSSLVLCPADNDSEDICNLGDADELDASLALDRLEDATTLATVEIPAGFAAAVRGFQPAEILYRSQEDLTAPGYIQQAMEAAIQRVNGAVVASRVGAAVIIGMAGESIPEADRAELEAGLYDRAAGIWEQNPIQVRYELSARQEVPDNQPAIQQGLGQSVPGMGSMFVMLTVFGGMTALIVERKQWTLQRIATTPITRAQLLGGKILARFSLGILQYLVVFAIGVVAGINFGSNLLALVLVAVSYTLAVTALSFALGTRLENETQTSGFSLLLSLILAPLGGAWWPLEIVPDFMQTIGHISPVAWAMDGFNALIFENGGLSDVILPIGVLLATTVVSFGLAIWRFRYD